MSATGVDIWTPIIRGNIPPNIKKCGLFADKEHPLEDGAIPMGVYGKFDDCDDWVLVTNSDDAALLLAQRLMQYCDPFVKIVNSSWATEGNETKARVEKWICTTDPNSPTELALAE